MDGEAELMKIIQSIHATSYGDENPISEAQTSSVIESPTFLTISAKHTGFPCYGLIIVFYISLLFGSKVKVNK